MMMNTVSNPHPVRKPAYWQSKLQNLYKLMHAMSEQPTQDLRTRAGYEREAGLIHTHLQQNGNANLVNACEYGAAIALARTLRQRSDAFQVKLVGEESTTTLNASGSYDFAWPHWFDTYCLALILRHEQALAILSTAECIDACAMPPQYIDQFWPFLCGALVTLVGKDPIATDMIEDAAGFMQRASLMDKAFVAGCYLPLMDVMRAVNTQDQAGFDAAVKAALQAFHNYYREAENGDAEIPGLYHLSLSALLVQAQDAGLRVQLKSAALLAPEDNIAKAHNIVAVYPTLSIYDAMEADWFMALEGFLQHSQSTLLDQDGLLVATYTAQNKLGIPQAELNFALLNPGDNPLIQQQQPALDVGQLIHIAQILSSEPEQDAEDNEHYRLNEAISALDLALRYIECMDGEVKPETLHSHIGRSLYDKEPGRFDLERLTVYRNALARQAGVDEIVFNAPARTESIQNQVMAQIEKLRQYALPVLQALAVDDSGEVVKTLQPLESDYAKVFEEGAAELAKAHYAEAWQNPELHISYDEDTRIDAHFAPAGMLQDDNPLSHHFPKGYQDIAANLNPHRIWVSWKYYQTGESSGNAFNGLVWVDDHWAWFPKPYRITFMVPRGGLEPPRYY